MKYFSFISIFLLVAAVPASLAQGPDRSERGGGGRGELNFKEGDELPDVAGVDEDGSAFPLKKLRGKHAVIVFGCLT